MAAVLRLLTVPVLGLMNGWVLRIFWSWFIMDTFHLQALSLMQAVGMAIFVNYMTMKIPSYRDLQEAKARKSQYDLEDDTWRQLAYDVFFRGLFMPLFFLFIGWLWHLFM